MAEHYQAAAVDAGEEPNGTGRGANDAPRRLDQLANELAAGRVSLTELIEEEDSKVIAQLATIVRDRRRTSLIKFIAEQIPVSFRAK